MRPVYEKLYISTHMGLFEACKRLKELPLKDDGRILLNDESIKLLFKCNKDRAYNWLGCGRNSFGFGYYYYITSDKEHYDPINIYVTKPQVYFYPSDYRCFVEIFDKSKFGFTRKLISEVTKLPKFGIVTDTLGNVYPLSEFQRIKNENRIL